jgi:hypothetical protein
MQLNTTTETRPGKRVATCCPIVELRQYTLHPHKRDVLINLFEREFVEPQEAAGITLIGQFRDLDNPDRFVWLRGFHDMPSRARALSEFYGGPVWKANCDAANATMTDSDNVLLLHPARPRSGFILNAKTRAPIGARDVPNGVVTATIYYLGAPDDHFIDFFEDTLGPEFASAGASILACFATENSPNNYPALPIREGEQAFIWFGLFRDYAAYQFYVAALAGSQEWRSTASKELTARIQGAPQELRLTPTARSRIHA